MSVSIDDILFPGESRRQESAQLQKTLDARHARQETPTERLEADPPPALSVGPAHPGQPSPFSEGSSESRSSGRGRNGEVSGLPRHVSSGVYYRGIKGQVHRIVCVQLDGNSWHAKSDDHDRAGGQGLTALDAVEALVEVLS